MLLMPTWKTRGADFVNPKFPPICMKFPQTQRQDSAKRYISVQAYGLWLKILKLGQAYLKSIDQAYDHNKLKHISFSSQHFKIFVLAAHHRRFRLTSLEGRPNGFDLWVSTKALWFGLFLLKIFTVGLYSSNVHRWIQT